MNVIRTDFAGANKFHGVDCHFNFFGIDYHLICHEDANGRPLGIDLTCEKAGASDKAMAYSQAKWITDSLNAGIPFSAIDHDGGNLYPVIGHSKVKMATTVTNAALQILKQRYEPEADFVPALEKTTKISFLRVLEGGVS